MATFGNSNQDDPLGIAVQARGMDRRRQAEIDSPTYSSIAPDPAWEGLFQAMLERGVNKVGVEQGQFGSLPSTYDANYQTTAETPSNSFGTAANSIAALRRLRGAAHVE